MASPLNRWLPFRWGATFLFLIALPILLLLISNRGGVYPYPPPVDRSSITLIQQEEADLTQSTYPTFADYWEGAAQFEVDVVDTGLPMGESETIIMGDGEWWSYVHASDRSAGVVDQCGEPVEFPGCTVIYRSQDDGQSFQLNPPVCQFACNRCPCDRDIDHQVQQQYPRVMLEPQQVDPTFWLVYEYLGRPMIRQSKDGLSWGAPQRVANGGLWSSLEGCAPEEKISEHPFAIINLEQCLAGGPPGIYIENDLVYIFVGMGQSPGSIGCFVGRIDQPPATFERCRANPLLTGSLSYGPLDIRGADANRYWDFRMLSSVDIQKIGDQYYMVYEGIRGPGEGDPGDTQFGIGLARTMSGELDGKWEAFSGNPILIDSPANIGAGHADIVQFEGETYLYTSLDGVIRSRLRLVWGE